MALALNGVTTQHPYAATRAATKGPDVVAYLTSASQATKLVDAAGVADHSGPYPVASGTIRFDGRVADVFAEGRTAAPAAVDQPLLTAGSWVRPGRHRHRTHLRRRPRRLGGRSGHSERQVVHRRRHRRDRGAGALSEPVQRHASGQHSHDVEVLECLPSVVQHPISLAPGRTGSSVALTTSVRSGRPRRTRSG